MATLVNLSDYRRRARRDDPPPPQGASIHLFLGVRYERHDESFNTRSPAGKSPGGRRSRKRA
jgi:hypothetical protein